MEKKLLSRISILNVLILSSTLVNAQVWVLQDSLLLDDFIVSAAIDQEGNVFIGSEDGSVKKVNLENQKLTEKLKYADPGLSSCTSIDLKNGLVPFTFYRDIQQITLLDRFLTDPVSYKLSDLNLGFTWLATPGADESIWLLTTAPLALVKVDERSQNVIFNKPISLEIDFEDITQLKSFQNFVFLIDQINGLHVYDQFGNIVKEIQVSGMQNIHVEGDTIFSATPKNHIAIDLKSWQLKISAKPVNSLITLKKENTHFFLKDLELRAYSRD